MQTKVSAKGQVVLPGWLLHHVCDRSRYRITRVEGGAERPDFERQRGRRYSSDFPIIDFFDLGALGQSVSLDENIPGSYLIP